MRKLILLSLFIVLFSISVFAQPPFQEAEAGINTLSIVVPKETDYNIDNNLVSHIHVYNSTGFLMKSPEVNCSMHVYNHSGSHILQEFMAFDSNGIDFFLEVPSGTFDKVGDYGFIIWCNSSRQGGFYSSLVEITKVTEPDPNIPLFNPYIIPTIIAFIVIIICFMVVGIVNLGKSDKKGDLKFVWRFIGFGFATIEILVMFYYVYAMNSLKFVPQILGVNFTVLLILSFALGMVSFIKMTRKLIDPTDEDTGDISKGEDEY